MLIFHLFHPAVRVSRQTNFSFSNMLFLNWAMCYWHVIVIWRSFRNTHETFLIFAEILNSASDLMSRLSILSFRTWETTSTACPWWRAWGSTWRWATATSTFLKEASVRYWSTTKFYTYLNYYNAQNTSVIFFPTLQHWTLKSPLCCDISPLWCHCK